ncbi:uncharacterized protein [Physeter macrocephalus]|uniref:Uncharacterized protein isoform X2 n=1 Tax=Physeter macrocephalus TaxID=9755 RepID=A0A455C800_PHYMC|nr:uncharacterized protein LOC114487206 isoform X2 [Physeter catodon]|eukprot:XP_028352050.1 uncharacterized protein LOC114487206 isoform X2 [Physeter catodon]
MLMSTSGNGDAAERKKPVLFDDLHHLDQRDCNVRNTFLSNLVPLAHRGSLADASNPAFQTRAPREKRLPGHLSSASCVQKGCSRHCDSRWRMRAVRRDSAPSTVIWGLNSAAAPALQQLHLPRLCQDPYKAGWPTANREITCSRALAPPFSDHRIKLVFASEPNLVLFYWLDQHWAEGPLLGTDSGGFVTLKKESDH